MENPTHSSSKCLQKDEWPYYSKFPKNDGSLKVGCVFNKTRRTDCFLFNYAHTDSAFGPPKEECACKNDTHSSRQLILLSDKPHNPPLSRSENSHISSPPSLPPKCIYARQLKKHKPTNNSVSCRFLTKCSHLAKCVRLLFGCSMRCLGSLFIHLD